MGKHIFSILISVSRAAALGFGAEIVDWLRDEWTAISRQSPLGENGFRAYFRLFGEDDEEAVKVSLLTGEDSCASIAEIAEKELISVYLEFEIEFSDKEGKLNGFLSSLRSLGLPYVACLEHSTFDQLELFDGENAKEVIDNFLESETSNEPHELLLRIDSGQI